jgi:NAD(P)-dependent dehydrogenase (short-subunit alcohol dehydrogenase family)
MDLELKGRVALVAASSQGLGKAVALGLAREGARVAMCSRNPQALLAAAAEIRAATGAEVFATPADVTKETEVQSLVFLTRANLAPSTSASPTRAVRRPSLSMPRRSRNGAGRSI